MGLYLEEAMKKFLKDNGISHGEMTDESPERVTFEWIDANISMKVIHDFEAEFNLFQQSHSGVEGEKWLQVEFIFNE